MKRIAVAMVVGLVVLTSAQADTYGRSERVRVVGTPGIEVDGLLDPAAKGSSLRAAELKYFNRGGGTWVRFTIDNGGVLPGSRITFERPVLKDLKIRQRDGSVEHRAQVALSLCVGRTTLDATLTVSDRSGYTAPLTIGAADLRRLGGSVDPAREFTVDPSCPLKAAVEPEPHKLPEPEAAPQR